jgi:hypothetical protein
VVGQRVGNVVGGGGARAHVARDAAVAGDAARLVEVAEAVERGTDDGDGGGVERDVVVGVAALDERHKPDARRGGDGQECEGARVGREGGVEEGERVVVENRLQHRRGGVNAVDDERGGAGVTQQRAVHEQQVRVGAELDTARLTAAKVELSDTGLRANPRQGDVVEHVFAEQRLRVRLPVARHKRRLRAKPFVRGT